MHIFVCTILPAAEVKIPGNGLGEASYKPDPSISPLSFPGYRTKRVGKNLYYACIKG